MGINIIFILVILGIIAFSVYKFLVPQVTDLPEIEVDIENTFTEDILIEKTRNAFDQILRTNVSLLNLNKFETEKSEQNKRYLRASLKKARFGDLAAKEFVKENMKDLFQKKFGISTATIKYVIPFGEENSLSAQDKFEILLHIYRKKYDLDGLSMMIKKGYLDRAKGSGSDLSYEISKQNIDYFYSKHHVMTDALEFSDELDILAQRIYQRYHGHGVIDSIRDMFIDGVNGGTSGIPNTFYTYGEDPSHGAVEGELPITSFNAVWLLYHGKQIRLSFLGFGSQRELERVCKNIYKFGNPGVLSSDRGYIINSMQDGSRIVVVRPPFSESWAFFVRKYDVAAKMSLAQLIPDEGGTLVIELLGWLIRSCRNIVLTGEQGCGKTTMLMSLVALIKHSYTIRVQETAFELSLRKRYPRRNILSFQETPSVSGQMGINLQKKTDGQASIMGEVAEAPIASLAMQQGQTGSNQLLCTHHGKTARDTVEAFRDNLVQTACYSNEKLAEKLVSRVLNFDVHLVRTAEGKRYIERITEILPTDTEECPRTLAEAQMYYYHCETDKKIFLARDIVRFEGGKYVIKDELSRSVYKEMCAKLVNSEKAGLNEFMLRMRKCVSESVRGDING